MLQKSLMAICPIPRTEYTRPTCTEYAVPPGRLTSMLQKSLMAVRVCSPTGCSSIFLQQGGGRQGHSQVGAFQDVWNLGAHCAFGHAVTRMHTSYAGSMQSGCKLARAAPSLKVLSEHLLRVPLQGPAAACA